MLGDHAIQFGGSLQRIKVNPYNYAARFPTVSFGFSPAAPAPAQLTQAQLPGITAADLATANNLLSFLSGTVTSVTQTFQVQDQSFSVGQLVSERSVLFGKKRSRRPAASPQLVTGHWSLVTNECSSGVCTIRAVGIAGRPAACRSRRRASSQDGRARSRSESGRRDRARAVTR